MLADPLRSQLLAVLGSTVQQLYDDWAARADGHDDDAFLRWLSQEGKLTTADYVRLYGSVGLVGCSVASVSRTAAWGESTGPS